MHPTYCLPFIQTGRLVKIKWKNADFGWGAVVNFLPRKPNKGETLTPQQSYVVDVLMVIASEANYARQVSDDLPPGLSPPPPGDKGKVEVVPVILDCIESIGHMRIFLPKDLKTTEQRNQVRKAIDEVKKRFPDGIPCLDPVENLKITDESFKKLLRVSSLRFVNLAQLTPNRKWRSLNLAYSQTLSTTRRGCLRCISYTKRRWSCPRKLNMSRKKSNRLYPSCSLTSSNAASEFCAALGSSTIPM